ncbi:MAG: vWA domain-containing protein [Deltaproteobacteria bacterium]
MADSIPNSDPPLRKCDTVADIVNNFLRNLSMKCVKEEDVRDYFHVGVIGYGMNVGPAWGGVFANRELLPISELAGSPAKIEMRTKKVPDGAGGLVEQTVKFPVWFEPVANGGTPMCAALKTAYRLADQWIKDHPASFPPCVIHITDGESTDSRDRDEANRMVAEAMANLKSLGSTDGNALLFNIHLSSNQKARPISLSNDASNLPDDYSRMLYEGSSELTDNMKSIAKEEYKLSVSDGSKCFALNADIELLFQCIDIGTRAANMR